MQILTVCCVDYCIKTLLWTDETKVILHGKKMLQKRHCTTTENHHQIGEVQLKESHETMQLCSLRAWTAWHCGEEK